MEIGNIIPHIEALIFASDKPLTAMELTELANNAFGFMDEKLTLEQIQTAVDGIVEKYRSEFYPFEVRESGGGLQFLTKKEYHKTVAQLNGEKFLKRLSTAALETLSIIAYKQPVTKGEIESIRGVSSDYAIQRLLEKELVVITGRNEKMPGHPLVYATSKSFMDYFGINSADDLPKLKEIFDEAMVSPTIMDGGQGVTLNDDTDQDGSGNNELLAVTQNGELTTARINKDADKRISDSTPNAGRQTDNAGDDADEPGSDEVGSAVSDSNNQGSGDREPGGDDFDGVEISETEVSETEVSETEVSETEVSETEVAEVELNRASLNDVNDDESIEDSKPLAGGDDDLKDDADPGADDEPVSVGDGDTEADPDPDEDDEAVAVEDGDPEEDLDLDSDDESGAEDDPEEDSDLDSDESDDLDEDDEDDEDDEAGNGATDDETTEEEDLNDEESNDRNTEAGEEEGVDEDEDEEEDDDDEDDDEADEDDDEEEDGDPKKQPRTEH
jgi:segregation and condensation protein B